MVWRRTGEVCLVGKEFLLLTQWPRDTLLNKKTYIYEVHVPLFDLSTPLSNIHSWILVDG